MMHIESRAFGPVTVLDCAGDFTDGEDVGRLKSHVNLMCQRGSPRVVLNMSHVTYLNSVGLGGIVQTFKRLSDAGGELLVYGLQPNIRNTLTMTRLLQLFVELESLDEIISVLGEATLFGACPICGDRFRIIPKRPDQQCGECEAALTLSFPDVTRDSADVTGLRLPTYRGEHVRLNVTMPCRIGIAGRVDLFAAEAFEQIWKVVPIPRQVVVVMSGHQYAITTPGWDRVQTLCGDRKDNRVALALEDLEEKEHAQFVSRVPLFWSELEAFDSMAPDTLRPMSVSISVERRPT